MSKENDDVYADIKSHAERLKDMKDENGKYRADMDASPIELKVKSNGGKNDHDESQKAINERIKKKRAEIEKEEDELKDMESQKKEIEKRLESHLEAKLKKMEGNLKDETKKDENEMKEKKKKTIKMFQVKAILLVKSEEDRKIVLGAGVVKTVNENDETYEIDLKWPSSSSSSSSDDDKEEEQEKKEEEKENLIVIPHSRVVAVRNPPNYRFPQRNVPFQCSMFLANGERTKGKAMFKANKLNISKEKRLNECIRFWQNAYYFCKVHLDLKTARPVSTLSVAQQIRLLDNIVAVLLNLLLACNDLGKLNHAKTFAKLSENHLNHLKEIAETSVPVLLQKTVYEFYVKLYDRMIYTYSKLEEWKSLVEMYKNADEFAKKIEDKSIRDKWIKKLKKRYKDARKYRESLKSQRKQAFGGKLSKTPSPKSKSKIVADNAAAKTKTTTTTTKVEKKKKRKILLKKRKDEDVDDGISTPVLLFGLLGLVCTVGVGLMWFRNGGSRRRRR